MSKRNEDSLEVISRELVISKDGIMRHVIQLGLGIALDDRTFEEYFHDMFESSTGIDDFMQ